jgi:hypothetical protein
MTTYQITHTCTHTQDHQVYGANEHGERDALVKLLAERCCETCLIAQIAAADAICNACDGLPELTGPAGTVAEADTIRARAARWLIPRHTEIEAAWVRCPQLTPAEKIRWIRVGSAWARAALAVIDDELGETNAQQWVHRRGTLYDEPWLLREVSKRL